MRVVVVCFLMGISLLAFAQADTVSWQKRSPLPAYMSAYDFGHFLIDSDFYVAGGWIYPGSVFSSNVWRYHMPTDIWYQMGNLPFGGAASSCSFVLNGIGY